MEVPKQFNTVFTFGLPAVFSPQVANTVISLATWGHSSGSTGTGCTGTTSWHTNCPFFSYHRLITSIYKIVNQFWKGTVCPGLQNFLFSSAPLMKWSLDGWWFWNEVLDPMTFIKMSQYKYLFYLIKNLKGKCGVTFLTKLHFSWARNWFPSLYSSQTKWNEAWLEEFHFIC